MSICSTRNFAMIELISVWMVLLASVRASCSGRSTISIEKLGEILKTCLEKTKRFSCIVIFISLTAMRRACGGDLVRRLNRSLQIINLYSS